MDYLKAFVIGSSGLVVFPELSKLPNDNRYDYSKIYSFIIPIYYGLMGIIALFIRNRFELSLQRSLLVVSVISISLIQLLNYNFNDKYYINSKQNNLFLIIQDIIRQFIIFSIMYYLTINFTKSDILKIFIIGSSSIFYLINYYASTKSNDLNYDYKYFVITEPIIQGFYMALSLYIGMKYFKLSYTYSIVLIYLIIGNILMVLIAHKLRLYKFNVNMDVRDYMWSLTFSSLYKGLALYYLLNKLK